MADNTKQPIDPKSIFQQEFIASAERGAATSLAALIHMLIDYHCMGKRRQKWTIFELIYGELEMKSSSEWCIPRLDYALFRNHEILAAVVKEYPSRNRFGSRSDEFKIWKLYSELCSLLPPESTPTLKHAVEWRQINNRIQEFSNYLDNYGKQPKMLDRQHRQALILSGTYKLVGRMVTCKGDSITLRDLWSDKISTDSSKLTPCFGGEVGAVGRLERYTNSLIRCINGNMVSKDSLQDLANNNDTTEMERRLLVRLNHELK